jgi:hypothetical protein
LGRAILIQKEANILRIKTKEKNPGKKNFICENVLVIGDKTYIIIDIAVPFGRNNAPRTV